LEAVCLGFNPGVSSKTIKLKVKETLYVSTLFYCACLIANRLLMRTLVKLQMLKIIGCPLTEFGSVGTAKLLFLPLNKNKRAGESIGSFILISKYCSTHFGLAFAVDTH